jgi:hypothetical protein
MNERIRELAKLCNETSTTYFDGRGNITTTHFNEEKFAELIVGECATYAFSDDQDRKAMLKHFGVEE